MSISWLCGDALEPRAVRKIILKGKHLICNGNKKKTSLSSLSDSKQKILGIKVIMNSLVERLLPRR